MTADEPDEAQARQLNAHLSLFAGQVSHDLRTPLTAILANAEMLSSEPAVAGDPDLVWMVDGITRAAHRMNAMIEEMVAYARRGGEPARATTDLGTVFAAAMSDLSAAIEERQAKVVLGILPVLDVDPEQMYDVALSLLSNAVKFSRPGVPPVVEVAAERRGSRWRVSVTDNGIGVAAEHREAMFVLFARADKRLEGNGIGLATAKRVVEAHGGVIGMDGAEGGGTTVWLELPV